jgi:hypothetical protein
MTAVDLPIPLLRTSERKDFKRCPWLWQESWYKMLRTRRVPTWSWFGTAVHKGLEARYPEGAKRGKPGDMIEAFVEAVGNETRKVWTEGGELDEQEIVDGKELGIAMLRGYLNEYGDDKDWVVIGNPELTFQIDVPHPTDPTRPIAVYAGTWDLVVWSKSKKKFFIVDHKTRKAFPSNWDFYDLDDQAGSYLWVAPEVLEFLGLLTKKELKDLRGLYFNILRKHLPDVRPRNAKGECLNLDGSVSKRQPAPLFYRHLSERAPAERAQQGRRVQQEARWMESIRNGTLEAFKTPTEDCIRCQLYEYCMADEYDKEEGAELAKDILMTRDVYRDHREAMADGGVEIKISRPKKKVKK